MTHKSINALKISVSLLAVALSSCATFKPYHLDYIEPAIALQPSALTNPLFREIMLELQANGHVVWKNRLNKNAEIEAGTYQNEMLWFLSKYDESGGLERAKLKAWRKWQKPWSDTTALYTGETIKLNLFQFNKDKYALANTFLHEKNHFFGLLHDRSQTRGNNYCDAGYLAGDLAEALLRSEAGNTSSSPQTPTCPALCEALEQRGLWSACKA